jgi:hypothetical protein
MAKTKIRPGIQDWLNDLEDNILDTLTDEELERLRKAVRDEEYVRENKDLKPRKIGK